MKYICNLEILKLAVQYKYIFSYKYYIRKFLDYIRILYDVHEAEFFLVSDFLILSSVL